MQLPCLPLIQERFWNEIKDKLSEQEKHCPEIDMVMFPQTWGSTALGFRGIGGQAMTSAYTVVVRDNTSGWVAVFFGESLAYALNNPNQKFYEDIQKGKMEAVIKSCLYLR